MEKKEYELFGETFETIEKVLKSSLEVRPENLVEYFSQELAEASGLSVTDFMHTLQHEMKEHEKIYYEQEGVVKEKIVPKSLLKEERGPSNSPNASSPIDLSDRSVILPLQALRQFLKDMWEEAFTEYCREKNKRVLNKEEITHFIEDRLHCVLNKSQLEKLAQLEKDQLLTFHESKKEVKERSFFRFDTVLQIFDTELPEVYYVEITKLLNGPICASKASFLRTYPFEHFNTTLQHLNDSSRVTLKDLKLFFNPSSFWKIFPRLSIKGVKEES